MHAICREGQRKGVEEEGHIDVAGVGGKASMTYVKTKNMGKGKTNIIYLLSNIQANFDDE